MNNNFIYPGFYENPNNSSEEKRDIVRIIGPSNTREDYWKTTDVHVEISEYDLIHNYIRVDMHSKQDAPVKDKSRLFADFEPIEVKPVQPAHITTPSHDTKTQETEYSNNFDDRLPNTGPVINIPGSDSYQILKRIEEPFNADLEIIERLNIDRCNAESFEKYGDASALESKPSIVVEFEAELNYNIDKVRSTIKLLNLDNEIIAEYLTKKIIEEQDIEQLIFEKVLEMLEGSNIPSKSELKELQSVFNDSAPTIPHPHHTAPTVAKLKSVIPTIPSIIPPPTVIVTESPAAHGETPIMVKLEPTELELELEQGIDTLEATLSNFLNS